MYPHNYTYLMYYILIYNALRVVLTTWWFSNDIIESDSFFYGKIIEINLFLFNRQRGPRSSTCTHIYI